MYLRARSVKRFTKGIPFLTKMVYERVRVWTSLLNFVEYPPGLTDKNIPNQHQLIEDV